MNQERVMMLLQEDNAVYAIHTRKQLANNIIVIIIITCVLDTLFWGTDSKLNK